MITVIGVNDAPVVTTSAGTTAYTEGDPATPVDPGLTAGDVDTNIASATVSITANFQSGEDELDFTNQLGITGSYNSGTGVLSLTGTAPPADYQTALRSVGYRNTSATPSTASRTVSFQASDGIVASLTATKTVSVTAVP